MDVHLVDGTYELFRYFFAVPSHVTAGGLEVGATRGVLGDTLRLLEGGATHVGVATDHTVESFRNELWPGYKTSAGIPDELLSQIGLVEDALAALGVVVWPMIEFEADDALASAAHAAAADRQVNQVVIRTVDKDLAQCVRGDRIVRYDRRNDVTLTEAAVVARFGIGPRSIPDYLALVGDSADAFPGISGFGPKTAATVLGRYERLEQIPSDAADWDVDVRGADKLAVILAEQMDLALLFRDLATLRTNLHLVEDVDRLRWISPEPEFRAMCVRIDAGSLAERAEALSERVSRGGRDV